MRQVIASKCRDEVPPDLQRRIAEALGEPVPPDDSLHRVAGGAPARTTVGSSRSGDRSTGGTVREHPCPRRLRRDDVAGGARHPRRAGGRRHAGARQRQAQWHYWIGFILAASMVLWLLVTLVGYYFRVIRPKHRGARPRDAGPGPAVTHVPTVTVAEALDAAPVPSRSTGRSPSGSRAASRARAAWPPRTSPARCATTSRRSPRRPRRSSPTTPACGRRVRPGPRSSTAPAGWRPTSRRCADCSRRSPHGSASAWRAARSRRSGGGSPAPRSACCSATSPSACSGSTTCSCSTTTRSADARVLRRRQHPGAREALRVPPRDFRLWIAIHEVTHRAQFTGVPWMKPYFLSLVESTLVVDRPRPAPPGAGARARRRRDPRRTQPARRRRPRRALRQRRAARRARERAGADVAARGPRQRVMNQLGREHVAGQARIGARPAGPSQSAGMRRVPAEAHRARDEDAPVRGGRAVRRRGRA